MGPTTGEVLNSDIFGNAMLAQETFSVKHVALHPSYTNKTTVIWHDICILTLKVSNTKTNTKYKIQNDFDLA